MPSTPLTATQLWPYAVNYVKTRPWKLSDDDLDTMNALSREVRAEREEQENAEV